MMRQMTPAVERLVRLMVLLPGHGHPLWGSLIADCGDEAEVMSVRWFVGDAAKMWPEAGPGNLARAVLTTFTEAGEATLQLLSGALLGGRAGDCRRAQPGWPRRARRPSTCWPRNGPTRICCAR